jgi:hypothetical protein
VAAHPVKLSKPEKLVYSPHEYGPEVYPQGWFTDASFPQNMSAIWDSHFGYINKEKTGHLLVGEFGIKDSGAFEGRALVWFESFLKYMGDQISWTYWSLNPNSGDTGGLLDHDWKTEVTWKLDKLRPYMAPLIGAGETGTRMRQVTPRTPDGAALRKSGANQNGQMLFSIDGRKIGHNEQRLHGRMGIYLLYDVTTGECSRVLRGGAVVSR